MASSLRSPPRPVSAAQSGSSTFTWSVTFFQYAISARVMTASGWKYGQTWAAGAAPGGGRIGATAPAGRALALALALRAAKPRGA